MTDRYCYIRDIPFKATYLHLKRTYTLKTKGQD